MDQLKRLRVAEQLLKQGKSDAALSQLRNLADESREDMLTLNRVGDLLARHKRTPDAVGYYRRIADKFTAGGYHAKAIAIHKKILRLDVNATESILELGLLYERQKLPLEARTYFERAGEIYLKAENWSQAQRVFKELLVAVPDDPDHRRGLAEAMASGGDSEGAGGEFMRLGDSLLSQQPEDAEAAYQRATELLPDRLEPLLGVAKSLFGRGNDEAAFTILETANRENDNPVLRGELIVRHDQAGRHDRAFELLAQSSPDNLADETIELLCRYRVDLGESDDLWKSLDPLYESWAPQFSDERLIGMLERLCGIEENGHLPAIERLLVRVESKGDASAIQSVLGRMVKACRAQGLEERASEAAQRLSELTPSPVQAPEPPTPAPTLAAPAAPLPPSESGSTSASEFEVPAVALKPADKEFVSGRLTQADILDNYGLADQAIQQVQEAIVKFPGEVLACAKLVELLRRTDNIPALRDALVSQAVAMRAGGDEDGARSAAAEAESLGVPLPPRSKQILLGLGLIAPEAPPPSTPKTSPPKPTAGHAPARSASSPNSDDDGVVIDFDGLGDDEPAAPTERIPGTEMLGEVQLYLDRRRPADALQRIEVLRDLGYAGDSLRELERLAREALPEPSAEPEAPLDFGSDDDASDWGESGSADDDLSAIAAALEAELLDESDSTELTPDAGSEQSINEVFAAFRERVEEQVDRDDHRTHYDLGIGYKEMGLLSEAIDEFVISSASPDLICESQVMIAICRRELGETGGAIEAYRKAVELAHDDPLAQVALHYELGELLVGSGDRDAALSEFRMVLESDPSFREVRQHVADLES